MLHNVAKTLGDPDFEPTEDAPEDEENLEINDNDELPLRRQGQEIKRNLSIVNNFNHDYYV